MRYSDPNVMDIALIDPEGFAYALNRRRPGRKLFPHIGLGYIAACLERNGDRVRVLDAGVATYPEIQRFLSKPANLIGITAVSFTFREAAAAAQACKHRYPGVPVLVGGPHVSIDPAGVLAEPAVDYALRGEAEETLIDLLEVLKRNPRPTPEVLQRVPGLVYRVQGEVRQNPPAPRLTQLDELPYPAWHLFPMRRYQQHALLTSRGCPMRCVFCAVDKIWGRQWLRRDPEAVVNEVAWLQQHYGNKSIHIHDDNFTYLPEHAAAFSRMLLRRRARAHWVAQGVRADALTPELLTLMRRAGCHRVSLGIESTSPAVLQAIGKEETVEDMARAVRLCREAGITVLGMFMVGNPGDTAETVQDSIAWARAQDIDLPAFYMAIPYPGTQLWEHARTHGRLLETDYLNFTHNSSRPLFETPEFPAAERLRVFAAAQRFCRRQILKYHWRFWLPPWVWRHNGREFLAELGFVLKWPGRLLRQAVWQCRSRRARKPA